jgi:hypothetical protein
MQGQPYGRCPADAPPELLCDPGAIATDALDGVLDHLILVCGHPLYRPARNTAASQALVPIHIACGINLTAPGSYNINFSVSNSAGQSAAVSRTLVVSSVCDIGEFLCSDQVCSWVSLL